MADITAAAVGKLREMTNAGLMDCKKALSETNGDFEAAVKWLREKGLAAASKKADRDTNQGSIFTAVSGSGAEEGRGAKGRDRGALKGRVERPRSTAADQGWSALPYFFAAAFFFPLPPLAGIGSTPGSGKSGLGTRAAVILASSSLTTSGNFAARSVVSFGSASEGDAVGQRDEY